MLGTVLLQGLVKRETRFASKRPADEIISKIEEAAGPLGFDVKKNNFKVCLGYLDFSVYHGFVIT